jgi:hypothetical protein
MMGGTIDDGTYFLTAMDLYNGETSNLQEQATWLLSGNSIQIVLRETGGMELRASATYVTLDDGLTLTFGCPTMSLRSTTYTAGGGTLRWVNPGTPAQVDTFTKQ